MRLATLIRYGFYPAVMVPAALLVGAVAHGALPAWPTLALVAVCGIALVAGLERVQPYERVWLHDHGDLSADVLHGAANLGLLAGTAYALHVLRGLWPANTLWPTHWPAWTQLLLAGVIVDLGLYAMHRFSHRVTWAWRLHAIHHSAERLYWLNGERRHPLSALLMAGPGLGLAVGLGAPPHVLSAWLALLSVQLAFQHANVDYRVGPLRRWLGVAEVHRWHHKAEYEDAQVNFGEFFMLWDRLFGTFLDQPARIGASEVGLREERMPGSYLGQLRWPFSSSAKIRNPIATAFSNALADGYRALDAGDADQAYALFERAHVLGQLHVGRHLRSHLGFLRWAWRFGDRQEWWGQWSRLVAATFLTWVWVPRGNTGGARVNPFHSMPLPGDIAALFKEARS